jgi:hypothetical protein
MQFPGREFDPSLAVFIHKFSGGCRSRVGVKILRATAPWITLAKNVDGSRAFNARVCVAGCVPSAHETITRHGLREAKKTLWCDACCGRLWIIKEAALLQTLTFNYSPRDLCARLSPATCDNSSATHGNFRLQVECNQQKARAEFKI